MKDQDLKQRITDARVRADLARLRFDNAVHATLHRVDPERLVSDARVAAEDQIDLFKQKLRKRLRNWPYVAVPLIAALAALMFWKPARVLLRYGARAATLAWTYRSLWRPKA
jgi:hypothetical protein